MMKIVVNSNNEITDYVEIGDLASSREINSTKPNNFEVNFKPGFYLLQDNEILENPNYQKPIIEIPETTTGPSAEMLAINVLGLQFAKHLAGGE